MAISGLAQFGLVGGGAAVGYERYKKLEIEMQEAARKQAEYDREQNYRADMEESAKPAGLQYGQGVKATDVDGRTTYLPPEAAAALHVGQDDVPADKRLKLDVDESGGLRTSDYARVEAGKGASFKGGGGTGYYDAKDPDAQDHVRAHNTAEGLDQRQKDVARKYGKFSDAASIQDIQKGETQNVLDKKKIKELDRVLGGDEELRTMVGERAQLPPGDPMHDVLTAKITEKFAQVHGLKDGMQMAKDTFALSEAVREASVKKREDSMWAASRTEAEALKHYNDEFKDGRKATVVVGKDGMRQIVDSEGNKLGAPYKEWNGDKGGRAQILQQIPAFAKEAWKLDYTHRNKMEEIAETGRWHMKYAGALMDKGTIKLTDTEKERFNEVDKALRSADDDKSREKAAKDAHAFWNTVSMAHGKEPKSWTGFTLSKSDDFGAWARGNNPLLAGRMEELQTKPEYKNGSEQLQSAMRAKVTRALWDEVQSMNGGGEKAPAAPAAGREAGLEAVRKAAAGRGVPPAAGPNSVFSRGPLSGDGTAAGTDAAGRRLMPLQNLQPLPPMGGSGSGGGGGDKPWGVNPRDGYAVPAGTDAQVAADLYQGGGAQPPAGLQAQGPAVPFSRNRNFEGLVQKLMQARHLSRAQAEAEAKRMQ